MACGIASGAAPTAEQRLELADSIKTSDHARFDRILAESLPDSDSLPEDVQWYLRYLKAWDVAYHGDYSNATRDLSRIVRDSPKVSLQFRAETTLMNMDAGALEYDRAFQRLVKLKAQVSSISDKRARIQFYATAAILYNKVGEYGLATAAARQLLELGNSSSTECKGRYFELLADYHRGQLSIGSPDIGMARRACEASGETMLGNSLRILLAKLHLSNGNSVAALALLTGHADEVRQTGYAELIADFDSVLASAYLAAGNPAQAEAWARQVIRNSGELEYSETLANAYKTLYLVDKARGDTTKALSWYEKYAAADKGYLNEVSAKSLAYQKVKQRVAASQAQTEAAYKQNRILQLQQTLASKVAETRGLYAILLVMVLMALSAWIWRLLRAQRRLRTLAEHDSLTGIANRQHFVNAAQKLLGTCQGEKREACLILLDLDHFKQVNDTHGHAAGDAVLKRTVLACQQQMRASDLFGRLGGEEFGILLPRCGLAPAREQAERVRSTIASLSSASHDTPEVTASVGVASTAQAGYELRQLMIHADDALYRAKRNGRNQVAVADGGISIVRTQFSDAR